jgi:hypothetical protein
MGGDRDGSGELQTTALRRLLGRGQQSLRPLASLHLRLDLVDAFLRLA